MWSWRKAKNGSTSQVHALHQALRDETCRVLIKVHILPGNDTPSKVGTKHSAIVSHPLPDRSGFGESAILSETELYLTEQYLGRVWALIRRKRTSTPFDQVRVELHQNSVIGLNELPPMSNVQVLYGGN